MSKNNSDAEHYKNSKIEQGRDSRRTFFKRFGLVGGAAVAGGAAIYTGFEYEESKPNHDTVKVLTSDNKLVEVPRSQIKDLKLDLSRFQQQGRVGLAGHRWVMVIDLSKCRNARKCIQACQGAHHLRPYEYHINTLIIQESADTAPYFMPKTCQHCDNPPCVAVCPVDATYKRQDGIVLIDNVR